MTLTEMLEQVCDHIHNYFETDVYAGHFSIHDGSFEDTDYLQAEQYFMVRGSVFNDGIYQYPASDLHNEEFDGEIWAMSIPRSFLTLVSDIKDWQEDYGEAVDSPFQSESYSGYYSYTMASSGGTSASGRSVRNGWQTAFRDRLNAWRKIA